MKVVNTPYTFTKKYYVIGRKGDGCIEFCTPSQSAYRDYFWGNRPEEAFIYVNKQQCQAGIKSDLPKSGCFPVKITQTITVEIPK